MVDEGLLKWMQNSVTRETFEVLYRDTVENVEAFLAGRPIRPLTPH